MDLNKIDMRYFEELKKYYLKVTYIASILIIIFIPIFYFKDIYLTKYPVSTFFWRLLPFLTAILYLISRFFFTNHKKYVKTWYFTLTSSMLFMICGICYNNIGLLNNKFNHLLLTSLITVFVIIYFFSKSMTKELAILFSFYLIMILLIFFQKNLSLYLFSNFFNPSLVFFISLILSHYNHKKDFLEFKLRINLEEEILKRKALESKLEKESLTDSLTNCYNKRAAMHLIEKEVIKTERYNSIFSLIYIDLDKLKTINDSHGHQAGDDYLCLFAKLVRHEIRISDDFFRLGGDEFLILFHQCNEKESEQRIQKIASLCSEYNVFFSFGIAEKIKSDSLTYFELINLADNRMYQNKRQKNNNKAKL